MHVEKAIDIQRSFNVHYKVPMLQSYKVTTKKTSNMELYVAKQLGER